MLLKHDSCVLYSKNVVFSQGCLEFIQTFAKQNTGNAAKNTLHVQGALLQIWVSLLGRRGIMLRSCGPFFRSSRDSRNLRVFAVDPFLNSFALSQSKFLSPILTCFVLSRIWTQCARPWVSLGTQRTFRTFFGSKDSSGFFWHLRGFRE